ncbi:MAG: hypothetical protein IJH83_04110, partial [Coriobacteriales bacterium]|nr:hypothetical protein [Coriobacteriales bacterium]
MSRGRHSATGRGRTIRSGVFALVVAVAAAIAFPLFSQAAAPRPNYDWYDAGASSYTISTPAQWVGFANLVNGIADTDGDASTPAIQESFAGKTVNLGGNLNFAGAQIEPVGGGEYGNSFDGAFDGQGNSIRNFSISVELEGADASGTTEYIGLFGRTGGTSSITDLRVEDA